MPASSCHCHNSQCYNLIPGGGGGFLRADGTNIRLGCKDSEETKNAFDRPVNSYRYYNCQNAELGYYPHYYIEESVYNNQKGNVK